MFACDEESITRGKTEEFCNFRALLVDVACALRLEKVGIGGENLSAPEKPARRVFA
jgi:hypothetical protein